MRISDSSIPQLNSPDLMTGGQYRQRCT